MQAQEEEHEKGSNASHGQDKKGAQTRQLSPTLKEFLALNQN